VFSRRAAAALIVGGSFAFALSMLLSLVGEDLIPTRSAGANTFSTSAIGHRAFVDVLRRLDFPVTVSRFETGEKLTRDSLVIVAEPRLGSANETLVADLLAAESVLYVLPKWSGSRQRLNPNWIEAADLLSTDVVTRALAPAAPDAAVVRPEGPVRWTGNRFGPDPDIAAPQLMTAPDLVPVVESDAGMLVGMISRDGRKVMVLSDPDLLSNHGLGKSGNAVLAIALIDALVADGGTIVVDETHHGFIRNPNLMRALFQPPYVIVSIQAALAIGLLLWTATARFGSPLPPPPVFRTGKGELIDNTADLLGHGGYMAEIAERYLRAAIRDVADRLHAPRDLREEALSSWLDRIGRSRGIAQSVAQITEGVRRFDRRTARADERLLRFATAIHRWKQDMTHGP
jgi:hypothetical protein